MYGKTPRVWVVVIRKTKIKSHYVSDVNLQLRVLDTRLLQNKIIWYVFFNFEIKKKDLLKKTFQVKCDSGIFSY